MKKHTGFFLETLLLIAVFLSIILVLTQVFGLAGRESARARQLTDAVTLASNAAEQFASAVDTDILADSLSLTGSSAVRYDRSLAQDPAGEYLVKTSWAPEGGLIRCTVEVRLAGSDDPIYTLETAAYRREAAE